MTRFICVPLLILGFPLLAWGRADNKPLTDVVEVIKVNSDPDRKVATLKVVDLKEPVSLSFDGKHKLVEIDGVLKPFFELRVGMKGTLVWEPEANIKYKLCIDTKLSVKEAAPTNSLSGNVWVISPHGVYRGYVPHGGADYPHPNNIPYSFAWRPNPNSAPYNYAWGPIIIRPAYRPNPFGTWQPPVSNPTVGALWKNGIAALLLHVGANYLDDEGRLGRAAAYFLREGRDELIKDMFRLVFNPPE